MYWLDGPGQYLDVGRPLALHLVNPHTIIATITATSVKLIRFSAILVTWPVVEVTL